MRLLSRCKTRRTQHGGILPVVLVLVSLTALMATAGLERAADQRLLASGADERGRLHEAVMTALARGVAHAGANVHTDDFSEANAGLFAGARSGRWREHPWDKNTDGFVIERLAQGQALQHSGKTVARCRLLVTARAQTTGGVLFAQALVSMPLPVSAATGVVVVSLPPSTLDAVRVITP